MHIFTRVGTFTGGARRPLEWAAAMTDKVNGIVEIDVTLWGGTFGYPVGTLAWSAMVESREQLAEQNAKLMADEGYHDLLEQGQEFQGMPAEDHLRTVVHMTAEAGDPPPVGGQAEIITAAAAAGRMGDVMAWGVEIADRFAGVTGVDAAFLADAYGTFGQVSWMSVYPDPGAVEAAAEATMADADYLAALDGAGDLFTPGSGQRGLVTRLA